MATPGPRCNAMPAGMSEAPTGGAGGAVSSAPCPRVEVRAARFDFAPFYHRGATSRPPGVLVARVLLARG
eukprot:CAMPEP_0182895194 /NCGR_PEP_ID=MMETSP0034_2-20130328/25542_1 /TAXON_ID=156128 /ORGANISM="Nephroselmis pyriformis, Strain CCMP717" /LENGTH=69 /DNA_ID=CAMNT_0025029017 /DNA_START=37 /DNA_END=242 /DNA_ORIENTATION=+